MHSRGGGRVMHTLVVVHYEKVYPPPLCIVNAQMGGWTSPRRFYSPSVHFWLGPKGPAKNAQKGGSAEYPLGDVHPPQLCINNAHGGVDIFTMHKGGDGPPRLAIGGR